MGLQVMRDYLPFRSAIVRTCGNIGVAKVNGVTEQATGVGAAFSRKALRPLKGLLSGVIGLGFSG